MDPQKNKEKIIRILVNLISRSIEEARKVPYLMEQDNLVDILISNPRLYQQMVLEGQIDPKGMSDGKVVVKLDILDEMAEFEGLSNYDMTFVGMVEVSSENSPVFHQIGLLSKMFMAYLSNLITIFEKSYEEFLERYRQTVREVSSSLSQVEVSWDDLEGVRRASKEMLVQGKFIQAFSIGRLLEPEVVGKDLILLTSSGNSFNAHLLQSLPWDLDLFDRLSRFVLRASYISHNHWGDLFDALVLRVLQDSRSSLRESLIQHIERDSVFCCNLLHETYENILAWRPGEIRKTIENVLEQKGHTS